MNSYLPSIRKLFEYYKSLADKTFTQLREDDFHYQIDETSNSIAIILKHIAGNMLSRWTDFLSSDGEKNWRNRDTEFIDSFSSHEEMLAYWEKGWACLFKAIDDLTEEDLNRIVYIRNQGHSVIEAINRQLSHYAYHVGQIVFLGKMILKNDWQTLSIPKGKSEAYNKQKFAQDKGQRHFTEDL